MRGLVLVIFWGGRGDSTVLVMCMAGWEGHQLSCLWVKGLIQMFCILFKHVIYSLFQFVLGMLTYVVYYIVNVFNNCSFVSFMKVLPVVH